ncbi:MAG: hypothetical protein ACKVP3_15335, partial [Hyphomicrobiaceae bacterium]
THARRGVLRTPEHAADPLGGLTPADDPLTQAECLSEQTGPPQKASAPDSALIGTFQRRGVRVFNLK